MKYHIIINACFDTCQIQAEQINCMISQFCCQMEPGYTIILCQSNKDKNQLSSLILTENVIYIRMNYYQPELVLKELETIELDGYILFGSGTTGNELATRLAYRSNGSSLNGITGLYIEKEKVSVTKMVYSNQMEAVFCMNQAPFCFSIAKGMERQEIKSVYEYQIIKDISIKDNMDEKSKYIFHKKEQADSLKDSAVILAAGRGIQKKEAIEKLEQWASRINGKLGISRPVAMNAWASMNRLLGVSGEMVEPEICVAVGVSGAAAFYSGIAKSKFIIAINIDKQAPIIKKANVSIIDDYESIMEELVACWESKV